nr:hypothetical protein [Wadden Sea poxvirus]
MSQYYQEGINIVDELNSIIDQLYEDVNINIPDIKDLDDIEEELIINSLLEDFDLDNTSITDEDIQKFLNDI